MGPRIFCHHKNGAQPGYILACKKFNENFQLRCDHLQDFRYSLLLESVSRQDCWWNFLFHRPLHHRARICLEAFSELGAGRL